MQSLHWQFVAGHPQVLRKKRMNKSIGRFVYLLVFSLK